MPKLTKTDEGLEVVLSGYRGDFGKAIEQVKLIPGRRYDPARKIWILPPDPNNAERVMSTIRPEVDVATLSWIKSEKKEQQAQILTPLPDDAEIELPWADKLYTYQRAWVDFASDHPRTINADDMGLGKTVQTLAAIENYQLRRGRGFGKPSLIVCPASIKGVWAREIELWYGSDYPYLVVEGTTPTKRRASLQSIIDHKGIAIVNYEQIRVKEEEQIKPTYTSRLDGTKVRVDKRVTVTVPREPLFAETLWGAVVADEAHRAKNRKALTTRGLWSLDSEMKLALTGTPIQNSPDEIWAILRWLFPETYNSNGSAKTPKIAYWTFFMEYVDHYETNHGKVITGVKNPDALRFALSKVLKRRTKGDVLDLPPKTRQFVPVTLHPKQMKMYKEAEKQLWVDVGKAIEEGDKQAKQLVIAAESGNVFQLPNGASRVMRLRQIASTPATLGGEDLSAKLDTAVDIITDAQKQIVVFSAFVETCHKLVERLEKKGLVARYYTGEVPPEERTQLEDQFQAGEIDVLVGTIDAMKEGITLHASDTVIFLERDWVPSVNDQCEDRLHRNGQKEAVTVIILEGVDTVDTGKIAPTNAVKRMIVGAVVQQDDVKEVAA